MKKSLVLFLFFLSVTAFSQQTNSVLSTGNWYKIAVQTSGIYRISYNDLLSYGIDVNNINPQNLALYGNGAGMLPESNSANRLNDLQPIAIRVVGQNDGHFDSNDYILFYGEGPTVWQYNTQTGTYAHETNIYTDTTFYYLTVGTTPGKRMVIEHSSQQPATDTVSSFDLLISHENELINPGKTGKQWLGETFSGDTLSRSFTINTNGFELKSTGHFLKINLANKNVGDFAYFSVGIDNQTLFDSIKMLSCSGLSYNFYRSINKTSLFSVANNSVTLQLNYLPPNDSAIGYLNYFELNLKTTTTLTADMQCFNSSETLGTGKISYFSLPQSSSQVSIWDVTNPLDPKKVETTLSGNALSFRLATDSIKSFCRWNGQSFLQPQFKGSVENQNLHAFTAPDMLIVTAPEFKQAAQNLATFHQSVDNMTVEVVDVNEIYNEFSSGKPDPTAIRDFVKYLYTTTGNGVTPAYLLLMGKGSYDYKNRIENNTDFIPVHETASSENGINSYASDDYFGILEDSNVMQVAIGRIPVSNIQQANAVINKIIHYSTSPSCLGKWKNNFTFIADDNDNNLHLMETDHLADTLAQRFPTTLVYKDYCDLFPLDSSTVPPTYPEVNALIDKGINEGTFFVDYTGHGNALELGSEKIVTESDLQLWNNPNKLPLWILSSGDVLKNDDPALQSLGEKMLLHNNGGAIATMGSTQANFASINFSINYSLINYFSTISNHSDLRLGDMLRNAKNHLGINNSGINKWNLLGDPALRVLFPKYNMVTTEINGIAIQDFNDTINPGTILTFTGFVSDENGNQLTDFNGPISLKMIDMPYIKTTLANQQGSYVQEVSVQDSLLVEGSDSVTNGGFRITVKMPGVYHAEIGNIKGLYYANNNQTDAAASFNLLYGGNPLGIKNHTSLETAMVYPTLFTGQLHVKIPAQMNHPMTCTLFDPIGRKIYSVTKPKAESSFIINVPQSAKGLYILHLQSGKVSKNFKLFKE